MKTRRLIVAILSGLFAIGTGGIRGQELPECFLEVSAYSPAGAPAKPFHVVSAKLLEEDEGFWSARHEIEPTRFGGLVVSDRRVYFERQAIGSAMPLFLRVETEDGRIAGTTVVVSACRQAESLFLGDGSNDVYQNYGWEHRSGRVTGCPLDGDWWVRLEPLWGPTTIIESQVEAGGRFSTVAQANALHLLVVVYGKEPIKAFTVDLSSRGENLGPFDIGDSCVPTSTIGSK